MNLIFYPPDHDPSTNTWGGGRPMGEYDPMPGQIVEWALAPAGAAGQEPEPGAAPDPARSRDSGSS